MQFSADDRKQFLNDRKPLDQGWHSARVFLVASMGTCPKKYLGKETFAGLVKVGLEIQAKVPGAWNEVRYIDYTASMSPKSNLRKLVEEIERKTLNNVEAGQYRIESLVGRFCEIEVVHNTKETFGDQGPETKIYDNIKRICYTEKTWDAKRPLLVWDFSRDEVSKLPESLQRLHMKSLEFKAKYPNRLPAQEVMGTTLPGADIPVDASRITPPAQQVPQETVETFNFD